MTDALDRDERMNRAMQNQAPKTRTEEEYRDGVMKGFRYGSDEFAKNIAKYLGDALSTGHREVSISNVLSVVDTYVRNLRHADSKKVTHHAEGFRP